MAISEDLGYLGRYQQGQEILLVVACNNGGLVPATPNATPVVTFHKPDGSVALHRVMAADLQGVAVGIFRLPQFLDSLFSTTGAYRVVVRYEDSASRARVLCGHFRVLAGGDTDGAVVSMRPVRRPNANYLVYQTDGGHLARGRNPR